MTPIVGSEIVVAPPPRNRNSKPPKPPRQLPEPARRLRELRIKNRYHQAVDAAREMGVSDATYTHHENGTRPITQAAAKRYGGFFNVPAGEILFGETTPRPARVLLVATVRDNGIIDPIKYLLTSDTRGNRDDMLKGNSKKSERLYRADFWSRRRPMTDYLDFRTIPAPPGVTVEYAARMAVMTVETSDMRPVFGRGDRLFYVPRTFKAAADFAAVHDRRCVVITSEFEMVIGWTLILADLTAHVLASGKVAERHIASPLAIWPMEHVVCPD